MSSGGIVILPAAVGVAAAAVVVVTVAAAAVLAVRAANAAAEGAARALGEFGAELEQKAEAQSAAHVSRLVWESVAAEVVEVNARIRMLAERSVRAGVAVTVPEPLSLTGRTVAEAALWAARAAELVAEGQAVVRAAVEADEGRRVAELLPSTTTARRDTGAALAAFQQALRERPTRAAEVRVVRPDAGRIDEILRSLDADADEHEHLEVLGAAARVVQDDPREARLYLRGLESKVAAVNGAVARRRLAAQWLAALEEPVVAAVEPPGPFFDTAARLHAVVAGEEDLTPELRARGAEAVEWAAAVTRQHFVRDLMTTCLTDLGYELDGEFDVQNAAEMRLSRPDWQGEHSAEVWMDRSGTLHAQVVRELRIEGDEAVSREQHRCADFNDDVRELGRRLAADVAVEDGYVPQLAHGAIVTATTTSTGETLYKER